MLLSSILLFVAILLLLCASAFFSGSETALTAASDARMHALANKGNKKATMVERLKHDKDRLISSLLIGNNLVNVLATSLATSAAIAFAGESGVLIATALMTVLLVLFAEVLPKTYAFNNADRFALWIALPVRYITFALMPLTIGLNAAVRLIIKPGSKASRKTHEEELRGMIALHRHVSDDEEIHERAKMLASVLDLTEVTVEEVMTHRGSVEMVSKDANSEEATQQVMNSPYTRLPVYEGKSDNITGVLHAKGLLRRLGKGKSFRVSEIATQPYFVPERTLLSDQLQAFRLRREHFAIVVDEYGDFRGIVTLEDILEEIVGEIDDEHDHEVSGIHAQEDSSWIVDGSVTIRDLNRSLGWNLPDDGASTVAGLIINEARTIPMRGQEFRFFDVRFKVVSRKRNKVERVRLWHDPQTVEKKEKKS